MYKGREFLDGGLPILPLLYHILPYSHFTFLLYLLETQELEKAYSILDWGGQDIVSLSSNLFDLICSSLFSHLSLVLAECGYLKVAESFPGQSNRQVPLLCDWRLEVSVPRRHMPRHSPLLTWLSHPLLCLVHQCSTCPSCYMEFHLLHILLPSMLNLEGNCAHNSLCF